MTCGQSSRLVHYGYSLAIDCILFFEKAASSDKVFLGRYTSKRVTNYYLGKKAVASTEAKRPITRKRNQRLLLPSGFFLSFFLFSWFKPTKSYFYSLQYFGITLCRLSQLMNLPTHKSEGATPSEDRLPANAAPAQRSVVVLQFICRDASDSTS